MSHGCLHRRRPMDRGIVIAAVIAAALEFWPRAAAPAVSEDVTHLPWRRAVIVEAPATHTPVTVEEDSILASDTAPDFADVRLMNQRGESVPLVLVRPARVVAMEKPFREFVPEWRAAADGEWNATFDLGPDPPSELVCEFTGSLANNPARLLGSQHGDEWTLLTQDPVRFDPPMVPSKEPALVVSRFRVRGVRRHMRLVRSASIPGPTSEDRVRLVIRDEIPTSRVELAFHERDAGYRAGSNDTWHTTIEMRGTARLVTRIDMSALRPGSANYNVVIDIRLAKGGWRRIDAGDPRPWAQGVRDSLVFEPVRTGAVRLEVHGADAPNPPLEILGVWATPQEVRFEADPGMDYWLGYGDRFAAWNEAPHFTEARVLGRATVAQLGPAERNPFFREPGFGLEWLRRRPAVLTVAMLVILGLVAWITLRRPGQRGAGAAP